MKSTVCWRNKFFSVGMIIFLMLFIVGCTPGGWGDTRHRVAPTITSANSTNFTVGTAETFTITATGDPTPSLTLTGTLPSGVTFDSTTGVLSGTPAGGTSGTYPLTITASNGVSPDATQNFILTVDTSGTTMAVCLRGAGQIAIIDLTNDSIIHNYPVGVGPQSIAISPDKTKFYVTDNPDSYTDSGGHPNCIHVVRVSDGTVLQTIDVGGRPWGVKVHPDGTKVYVSVYSTDEVVVINTSTYNVDSRIAVGDKPTGIAISPDGSKLAVPNNNDYTISVIDTATEAVITSSTTRGTGWAGPWELAFSPDGTQIWVDDSGEGNTVMIYSPVTLAELDYTTVTFPFNGGSDGGVHGFAFTPDGTKVFVGSAYAPEMFVLDPTNMNVLYTIDTLTNNNGYAKRMAMSKNGAKLYYSSHEDYTITVIDTATYAILNTITFNPEDYPNGMVIY